MQDNSCMFHIVLVHPEIPPNTGNIIRLAANTGCTLHLIEPLGFSMEDKHMRRAGLDYHEYAPVLRHADWPTFLNDVKPDPARMFAMTTKGSSTAHDMAFQPGDWFVFGAETSGLPADIRESFPLAASTCLTRSPSSLTRRGDKTALLAKPRRQAIKSRNPIDSSQGL
jgi:tRNA (cytidine/uridine-2'-O-)-methyltransferase